MTMAGGTPGRSHTHCVQANDAKLFASCAMMRRADRGEGRITHGDDTRDGEPLTRGPRAGHDKRPRLQHQFKFKIGTWPAAGAARCKRSPLQARGCEGGTPTTDT